MKLLAASLVSLICLAFLPLARQASVERGFGLARASSGSAIAPQSADPVRSLERIESASDFELLSRVYRRGSLYALPNVMFVIDRSEAGRTYYVNSKLFGFHKEFVNATYLSLERGRVFYENNHLNPNRRFLLGTIARQMALDKYTFEFWEGDRLTPGLLGEAYEALARTFYAPLFFKPNSKHHEEAAALLNRDRGDGSERFGLPVLEEREFQASARFQPLNLASGIGQLRIIHTLDAETVIDRNQIVIFKEIPVQLAPLSGIIAAAPSSPLSHINMLAKSWGIPNAYIENADRLFKHLEGKYVRLEVRESEYSLSLADPDEVARRQLQLVKRADLVTPSADLDYGRLTYLQDQRAQDARRFGAKSANLGEIANAKLAGVKVPPGFTIPFRHYREFILSNGLEEPIALAVEEERFVHDPKYRKARLAEIRRWIQDGRLSASFKKTVLAEVRRRFAGKGLFVRSSTNAEDLPDFSGAGLYTTVPNVRAEEQVLEAIKTVWASVWNFEAYEARENYGMNHFGVYPAVLLQQGVDADSAGVAITADPFDRSNRDAVYINAKRGLGIRVVEGRRLPEQIIYNSADDRIVVLTRSEDDTMLSFDARGGIKQLEVEPHRAVLTDEMARRLARAALAIERLFGGRDQDVEWLYQSGTLYIVQSRPFVAAE